MFLKRVFAVAVFAVAFMFLPVSLSAMGMGGASNGKYNDSGKYGNSKHSGSKYGKSCGKSYGKSCRTHGKKHCGKHHRKGNKCDSYNGSKSCGKSYGKSCKTHGKKHCGKHHRKGNNCDSYNGSKSCGKSYGKSCKTHGKKHCGKHHKKGYNCTPIQPQPPVITTGKVTGKVYIDENGNGWADWNEGLSNITVKLTDENGDTKTAKTDDDGDYYFGDIPSGTATIRVVESTIPGDVEQVDGSNPSSVYVESNKEVNAGNDGYVYQQSNPTGSVSGKVFIDANGNGWYESGEGANNITIKLTDVDGNTKTIYTDSNGYYLFQDIPSGTATVRVDESTLPNGSYQVYGENPSSVFIESNKEVGAGYDGYAHQQSNPTGSVSGKVFIDANGNGWYESGEGANNITIKLTDVDGNTKTTNTDSNGYYLFKDIPSGAATVKVVESTLPNGSYQVYGENPSSVFIESNKEVGAGYDGYAHQQSNPTGNVSGVVYIDKNNNGWDDGNEGVGNITVTLTDENGNTVSTKTDSDGDYYFSDIPTGTVTILVVESTLPINAKQVDGENPSTIYVSEGKDNLAGKDGYYCD